MFEYQRVDIDLQSDRLTLSREHIRSTPLECCHSWHCDRGFTVLCFACFASTSNHLDFSRAQHVSFTMSKWCLVRSLMMWRQAPSYALWWFQNMAVLFEIRLWIVFNPYITHIPWKNDCLFRALNGLWHSLKPAYAKVSELKRRGSSSVNDPEIAQHRDLIK